jgi:hypothetical protein
MSMRVRLTRLGSSKVRALLAGIEVLSRARTAHATGNVRLHRWICARGLSWRRKVVAAKAMLTVSFR